MSAPADPHRRQRNDLFVMGGVAGVGLGMALGVYLGAGGESLSEHTSVLASAAALVVVGVRYGLQRVGELDAVGQPPHAATPNSTNY